MLARMHVDRMLALDPTGAALAQGFKNSFYGSCLRIIARKGASQVRYGALNATYSGFHPANGGPRYDGYKEHRTRHCQMPSPEWQRYWEPALAAIGVEMWTALDNSMKSNFSDYMARWLRARLVTASLSPAFKDALAVVVASKQRIKSAVALMMKALRSDQGVNTLIHDFHSLKDAPPEAVSPYC